MKGPQYMDRKQREKEMREMYPKQFNHPEIRPGEIWLGDQIFDLAIAHQMIYSTNGLPNTRLGNPSLREREGCGDFKFDYRPLFADLQEVLALEEKSAQEKKQGQEMPGSS